MLSCDNTSYKPKAAAISLDSNSHTSNTVYRSDTVLCLKATALVQCEFTKLKSEI